MMAQQTARISAGNFMAGRLYQHNCLPLSLASVVYTHALIK